MKISKPVEIGMNHVRRRLPSSTNNVSNMRLEGAMAIHPQVQVLNDRVKKEDKQRGGRM
jgi:hypothetical protein